MGTIEDDPVIQEMLLISDVIDLLAKIAYTQHCSVNDVILAEDLIHQLTGHPTLEAYVDSDTRVRRMIANELTAISQDLSFYDD